MLPLDLQDALNLRGVIDIARPDAVAHLAAQAFVPAAFADPWTTHDVNAGGTLRLLEAIRAARASGGTDARIIVVGSADIYGTQPAAAHAIVEETPLHPANAYAASKVAAEAYALAAAVWNSFGSWLRTIRPGVAPSELVVASALRQSLPNFLLNSVEKASIAKFIVGRQDHDTMEMFSIAS
jgi:nucleoside-diphosphate-sugar epimerase